MTTSARTRWTFVAGLFVVLAVAAVERWRMGDLDRPFETDEADYVRAMSSGWLASYFATRERSGLSFLTEVLTEYRRTGWARPFQRDWDADDAAGLRHYHPPLAFYPIGVMRTAGVTAERVIRMVPLVTGIAACFAGVWLAWVLLDGTTATVRRSLSVAAGLLAATSSYHVVNSTTISPHAAFSLLSVVTLACLTRAIQTASRRWWWAGCAALGVTTATVPYWLLLLPAAFWTWWTLPSHRRTIRELALAIAIALAAVCIVWPPMLLELAFVKPALMYGGIILKPLVTTHVPGFWIGEMVGAHALLMTGLVVSLLCAPLVPVARRSAFVPAALFSIGFVLLNLRVGHMKPLYAAGMVVPLAAATCGVLGQALVRARSWSSRLAPALAALVVIMWLAGIGPRVASPEWRPSFERLDRDLSGHAVLVTPRAAGAMIKYYVPSARAVLDSGEPADVRHLEQKVREGKLDAVLRWGSTTEPNGVAATLAGMRPPDGEIEIGTTPVSWWRVASPGAAVPAE